MKIINNSNNQYQPNFKAKFELTGTINRKMPNIDEAVVDAFQSAAVVGNEIISQCNKKKIPIFMFPETSIAAQIYLPYHFPTNSVDDLPHEIVRHSFLIGDDAAKFKKSIAGVSGCSPDWMKIPQENVVDSRELLDSVKEGTFNVRDMVKSMDSGNYHYHNAAIIVTPKIAEPQKAIAAAPAMTNVQKFESPKKRLTKEEKQIRNKEFKAKRKEAALKRNMEASVGETVKMPNTDSQIPKVKQSFKDKLISFFIKK